MCSGVRGVIKLSEDHGSRDGFLQLFCLGNGTLHALGALGQDQLCAVGLHQLAALDAHRLRHHDDDAVAAGGGDGRQTDTGVAGGRFDDGAAGSQTALRLRPGDHVGSHPVLGAARGIHALQLGQQHSLQVVVPLVIAQLQQGRAADQLSDAVINRHRKSLRSE